MTRHTPPPLTSGPSCIVAVGASAGGIEPLQALLSLLPPGLNAGMIVATHRRGPSRMESVLQRRTALPLRRIENGMRLATGQISVASPGSHVGMSGDRLYVRPARAEDRFVPSIDALFTSLCQQPVPVLGIVLSGVMDDGTNGALALHRAGHTVIVQDPDEAQFGAMPRAVIRRDHPDAVLSVAEIARYIGQFTMDAARLTA
ncbi:MAG: chemotaxis protein CheB [Shimia sp.]